MVNKKSSQAENNTAAKIASQRKKSIDFKNGLGTGGIGLYEQTKKNERFFVGDQWLGTTTKSKLPLVNYNVIHRIGEYKLAQILSNPLTASFCAEGIPSFMTQPKQQLSKDIVEQLQQGNSDDFAELDENDKINITFTALSDYYNATSERLKLNMKYAECARNAYISGTGALYFYWDENINTGLFSGSDKAEKIMGDVQVEVLSAEEQLDFENPAETDINQQDFIIISKKVTVAEAKRIAKANGVSKENIEKIKADGASEQYAYERDEKVDDVVERVTIMTKLFKEYSEDSKTFSIFAVQCTEKVIIRPEWDTRLKRYPIALFQWEQRGRCIFGDSEITTLIPNQVAVNRMITASVWSAMLTGMPILIVDENIVSGEISNEPGQVWRVNGEGDLKNAATYLNPPSFSSALMNTSSDIISNTMSNAGANDAALGELRSDNATAIIALREAATAPMQTLKNRYYQFVEDAVRILADIWITFYGTRKLKISDKQGNWYLPFDSENFKDLVVSVRIDVGASTIWSQAQAQQILDSMRISKEIDFIQYLERIPKGLITDVQGLIDDYKKKQAEALQQQQAALAKQNSIENLGTDDFYNQLTPEERKIFDSKSYKEQQEIIAAAKQGVREERGVTDENAM